MARTHGEKLAYDNARAAGLSRLGRDIGPAPRPENPRRRSACKKDFRRFCLTYFAPTFPLSFSADHLRVIAKVERAVISGELFAVAMPRGSGKTTLCELACLFALLYAYRSFVVLIGSDEEAACRSLDSVKVELETNELLHADFPEVCYPIQRLDRIAHRCKGQTSEGEPTYLTWSADSVVLPTVKRSKASGACIKVAGLTGSIRGLKHKRPDGTSVRPDLVVIDDPQTDEALDLDTPIPTPHGFVRMGDLQVGDSVFDEAGAVCRITGVSPIMHGRECYRVAFDDGGEVVADGGHLWTTSTALQRTNARRKVPHPDPRFASRPQCQPMPFVSTLTTKTIAASLSGDGGRRNHSIPLADPIQLPAVRLPIPPYTLGVWLGDGSSAGARVTSADPEILDEVRKDGFEVGPGKGKAGQVNAALDYHVWGLRQLLRRSGLLGNKHLPDAYWFASPEQRLSTLQGLMDTDGSVTTGKAGVKGTRCTFSNTNRRLIDAVLHLCWSLGIKARCRSIKQTKPEAAPGWVVTFITSVPVFRLSRKARQLPAATKPTTHRRYVASVEQVESRPVRCIAVDSPSRLYLCSRHLIPTHNSARSASQCAYRERVLSGAVLGLAGPGRKIAGLMPCTVISPGDMADRILSPAIHPRWNGERTKMLYGMPENLALWDRYKAIRDDSLRAGGGGAEATEFYLANRAEMDRGCRAAWDARFEPGEASAIQSAMNIYLAAPEVFAAEYQNEPVPLVREDRKALTADQIAARVNHHARGAVPGGLVRLTASIDVQQDLLYWCVCAWSDDFTGSVIDYGVWPDQPRAYFALRDANPTLSAATGVASLEGSIHAGLTALSSRLIGREWPLANGGGLRLERLLIDANWGQVTDAVYRWCARSPYSALISPSHGKGIGPGDSPMASWQRREGERRGLNWVMPPPGAGRVRHVTYDTNYWKSFAHSRFGQPAGERGALELFGADPRDHRLFADHLTAESSERTSGRGREVDVWKLKPGRPDNHWLDCLVGCAVAASVQGCQLAELRTTKRTVKFRSWEELKGARR